MRRGSRSPAIRPGYRAGRPAATKGRRFPPEPLTVAEVERLKAACSRRAPTGIRNRALVDLLARTGLRVSEALALRPVDINLEQAEVTVLHGKGDRHRVCGILGGGAAELELWFEARRRLGLARASTVFCTLEGRPLQASYVRALLPRLAARAGIAKRVHPHGLRHSHATELVRRGVPLHMIQAQLGHANIAGTSRYIARIAPAELVATLARIDWRGEHAAGGGGRRSEAA